MQDLYHQQQLPQEALVPFLAVVLVTFYKTTQNQKGSRFSPRSVGILVKGSGVSWRSLLRSLYSILNPRKLEHVFRRISARIPYTLP